MSPGLLAFLAGGDTADRIRAVEAALQTTEGRAWRDEIGKWITRMVPVETLVPGISPQWRPLLEDAFQFVFSRLSDHRLAAKVVDQFELPAETPAESRLSRLITRMPGLQKLGQVLARNRRLPPRLREELIALENGMSDMTAEEVRAIIVEQLGGRLETHSVALASAVFKEGSASAVIRFTWRGPAGDRERERGVFKVLKPYVPACFGEDMTLLQELGEFLASPSRAYDFAVRDLKEMLAEVRILLEHELDFAREQATLAMAHRAYRSSIGIRVPRVFECLSTATVTAMSDEDGVKVTDAFPNSPVRRRRIAQQVVEALLAVPLFSRERTSVFHADPHAGNLLYDEPNRELIVLDWALAERLSLESRRQLVMLVLMMNLRHPEGVRRAVSELAAGKGRPAQRERLIERLVNRFFSRMTPDHSPGALDAMLLMDEIALEGVRFSAPLFLFRKIVFTLDGVLRDVAGSEVRIDQVLARDFLTRWISSFGGFHAPLGTRDFLSVEWNALLYPVRRWRNVTPPPIARSTRSRRSPRGYPVKPAR